MPKSAYAVSEAISTGLTTLHKVGFTFFFMGKFMMPTTIVATIKYGRELGGICLGLYALFIGLAVLTALYGMFLEPYLDTEKRIKKLEKKLEKLKAA